MTIIDSTIVNDGNGEENFDHRFDTDGDASTLEAGEKQYNLSRADEAEQALEEIKAKRQALKDKDLSSYEDISTEYGVGGRTRLLYDQVRAQLAVGFHNGEHDMSWEEQSEAADDTRIKVAKIRKAQKAW